MVEWVKFPRSWNKFYKERSKRPFTWQHANGNCAFVANLYRKFMNDGENQYGFFHGAVTHPYWHKPDAPSICIRHGWLLVKKRWHSLIVDPTRWCFHVDEEPLLAIAPSDSLDYDAGMRRQQLAVEKSLPPYDPEKKIACDCKPIQRICEYRISVERLFWLANLMPGSEHFKDEKERIKCFRWLQDHDYKMWIPIDNRV